MNNDTITLDELYKGKAALVKNKEYFSSEQYVAPFIDRMSAITNEFRIQVKKNDVVSLEEDKENIIYNRVLVQAVLPEKYTIDNHKEVIGMVYGIDIKKPVVKIFRNYENQACTNMCVFSPSWQVVQELAPGEAINYKPVKEILELTNDFEVKLKHLKNTYLDFDKRKEYLGEWVDRTLREVDDYGYGKVKLSATTPIEAYKQLFIDKDSAYYQQESDFTLFDAYNSFTQVLSDDRRDILQKFSKVMLINRILGVN